MKHLLEAMNQEQQRFSEHPFFAVINQLPVEMVLENVLTHLSFWIYSFQDLMPRIEHEMSDPILKRYAELHRIEDTGHDNWLLEDCKLLGCSSDMGLQNLYKNQDPLIRHLIYDMMCEPVRLSDDRLRVAFIMSLESSGHVFFRNMSELFAKKRPDLTLKYFGRHHLQVEYNHTVFLDESTETLKDFHLPDPIRSEGLAMVKRTHDIFHRVFDIMHRKLTQ